MQIGQTHLARSVTLGDTIRANGFLHAEREALIDGKQRITHRELERRTNRLARKLLEHGARKGDRVAVLLPDGVQFVEMLIAAGKAGVIFVMLNWRLSPSEIEWIVGDAGPRAIYFAERFAHLVPDRSDLEKYAVADEALAESRYEQWANGGRDDPLAPELRGTDPLFMMFTSGTTGRPKGCLQSHEGAVIQALAYAARRGHTSTDVNLSINPLFHVGGLGQMLSVLLVGGANVFIERDLPDTAPIDIAVRERCTLSTLSRPLLRAYGIMGPDVAPKLHFRSLTYGAGMVDPASIAFVQDEWKALVVGGWGQTESWGFATFIDYPEMVKHPKAVGWPLQHVALTILDDNGHPSPDPDAVGELGVRGPGVMVGYWNNPAATEAALGTGWLRSGDVMKRDALGLFTMEGRAKELIKSAGENVYPAEVESVLQSLPGVVDAAIAGVEDAKWGEAVKAFIVLKPGATLTAAEMTAACRARIAGYKRPRYLEFVDEIPRDYIGKIRRYQLSARPVRPDQAVD